MKLIVSRANPTFKALRLLADDVREQRRRSQTLIEGEHLVACYCEKVGLPVQLLISEHGAAQGEILALAKLLEAVPTVQLRNSLFGELSGLASPTGIAAIIAIPPVPTVPAEGSCVLLDAVQDAGNVGSILRTAAAAGIRDVFLGPGCAGVWTPRVLRAAQGAHFDLCLREQADLAAVMSGFRGTSVAATAHGDENVFSANLAGKLAWVFGSEGQGILPSLEAIAGRRVTIPLAAGCESLNVAAAAAICLFEEVRQKKSHSPSIDTFGDGIS